MFILVVTLLILNLSSRLLAKILLYCRGAGGDIAKSSRACVAVVLTNWQLTLAKRKHLDAVCVLWYLEGVCGRFYNHPVLPHEPPSKKMILQPATVATPLRVAQKHHRFRQENGSGMTLQNSSKVKQRVCLRYVRKSNTA